jgi:integrase
MNRPRKHDKHLPQCVYYRGKTFYYVKGGKWTPIGKTLDAASKAWANIIDGAPGTMGDLLSKALPIICKGVKPNTAKQYQQAARKLAKILAEFRVVDVTQGTVAQLKRQLSNTPNMANRCLSVLRLAFHIALEDQVVTVNPVIGIKRHKEAKRTRLLTIEELSAIYTASGARLRVIIDLCLRTGQRIGDVLAIKRADISKDGIAFTQQKTGAKIVVPWTSELREVVERAKTLNQNIRAFTLLNNRRGKAPDYRTVREQWDKACERAKVTDAHLHDLRAMSATWAKRQGINASSLLGHATPSNTARYLRDRDATVAEGPSFGESKNLLESGR